MKKMNIDLPKMYADHHVTEVRNILLGISGVKDVYASSAFRQVVIEYDPGETSEGEIAQNLEQAGYMGELEIPVEADAATYLESDRSESYFRHTAVFETNREVVSFGQKVSYSGRPLWNCPGIGVIKNEMED